MPIKSYLVFPQPGKEPELFKSLQLIKNCDLIPADNYHVFVLVTDTEGDADDEALLLNLNSDKNLHHINFISGFTNEPYEKGTVQH